MFGKVELTIVGFSDKARTFTLDDALRLNLEGSTLYTAGAKKLVEVMEYIRNEVPGGNNENLYLAIAGDGDLINGGDLLSA